MTNSDSLQRQQGRRVWDPGGIGICETARNERNENKFSLFHNTLEYQKHGEAKCAVKGYGRWDGHASGRPPFLPQRMLVGST